MTKDQKKHQMSQNRWKTDKQFFVGVNARTLPLKQYMELNAERFAHIAKEAAELRKSMKNHGWTDKKYQRLTGHIPDAVFNERPEFSAHLPQAEFQANIKKFLSE